MSPEREDALLAELRALYAEADALLEGWTCGNTAECCRFALTGREPYLTSIEAAALRRALGEQGKRKEAAPKDRSGEERCPFLDAKLQCRAYADRPIGCRTFYCHRALPGGPKVTHQRWRELVRQIEALAERHQRGGSEGRPIRRIFPSAR